MKAVMISGGGVLHMSHLLAGLLAAGIKVGKRGSACVTFEERKESAKAI
jgi:hypothetical protein